MDIFDVRQQNLLRLIETEFQGSQTTLAKHLGLMAAQVNRWANGKKTKNGRISERSARQIEEKCEKHFGWLDVADLVDPNQMSATSRLSLIQSERSGGIEMLLSAWLVADENQRDVARAWASSVIRARQTTLKRSDSEGD